MLGRLGGMLCRNQPSIPTLFQKLAPCESVTALYLPTRIVLEAEIIPQGEPPTKPWVGTSHKRFHLRTVPKQQDATVLAGDVLHLLHQGIHHGRTVRVHAPPGPDTTSGGERVSLVDDKHAAFGGFQDGTGFGLALAQGGADKVRRGLEDHFSLGEEAEVRHDTGEKLSHGCLALGNRVVGVQRTNNRRINALIEGVRRRKT